MRQTVIGAHTLAKNKPTTFRLSADVQAALERFAEDERRSVSSAAEVLMEEGLKRRRYLTPTGKLGKLAQDRSE